MAEEAGCYAQDGKGVVMAIPKFNPDSLTDRLNHAMFHADWDYGFSDDAGVRRRGADEVDSILKDLHKLAHSDPHVGKELAKRLWDAHVPTHVPMPQFLQPQLEQSRGIHR